MYQENYEERLEAAKTRLKQYGKLLKEGTDIPDARWRRAVRWLRALHWQPFVKSRKEVVCEKCPVIPEERESDLSPEGPSLRERYVRGELQVWVWLKLRGVVLDDGYYLAVFDRRSGEFHGNGSSVFIPVGATQVNGCGRDYEFPVLVKDVQTVDGVDKETLVCSVVRLYRLDNGECASWNFSADSEPFPFSRIRETFDHASRGLRIADRELGAIVRDVPSGEYQLPREMV